MTTNPSQSGIKNFHTQSTGVNAFTFLPELITVPSGSYTGGPGTGVYGSGAAKTSLYTTAQLTTGFTYTITSNDTSGATLINLPPQNSGAVNKIGKSCDLFVTLAFTAGALSTSSTAEVRIRPWAGNYGTAPYQSGVIPVPGSFSPLLRAEIRDLVGNEIAVGTTATLSGEVFARVLSDNSIALVQRSLNVGAGLGIPGGLIPLTVAGLSAANGAYPGGVVPASAASAAFVISVYGSYIA